MEKQQKGNIGQGKYLAFSHGRENHGFGIVKVKEVTDLMSIISVPGLPVSMEGVINYRGKFIPVVDIRQKCTMESAGYTEKTCIMIVEMLAGKGVVSEVGIIVDAISEVINIKKKAAKLPLPLAKKEMPVPF
ncbi:MAG: chemotaxis protein CheW [Desulfobulbaceae bacterium]|nr:chemotaxis protein CheW [Desulfobulbaceae bacterium]